MRCIAAALLAVIIAGCTPAIEQVSYANFTDAVSARAPECSVIGACFDAYENVPTTRAGSSRSVSY